MLYKSLPSRGDVPNWYMGLKTQTFGDYFGSLASLSLPETYLTHDHMYIVHRDGEGKVSVSRNACAHAGAPLLAQPGMQDVTVLRCPIHKWAYKPDGRLQAAPHFKECDGVKLEAPEFGVWNGYVLGYPQEELDVALKDFGKELGIDASCFDPRNFVFMGEKEYALPYPRELMMINYFDGYHVPLYHQKTFNAVADCETYMWDMSPDCSESRPGYSIQLVRARHDVALQREIISNAYDVDDESTSWADLHLWLRKELRTVAAPLDRSIFALWGAVYGNAYLMPELYEGGLFLAVSYLVSKKEANGESRNINMVEYYVHKNIPESHRIQAMHKFSQAYEASAREDDEICEKIWSAHRIGNMPFRRVYHNILEAGDIHYREWHKKHFVVKS